MAGRPPRFTGKERDRIIAELQKGRSMADVAAQYSCCPETISKIKKQAGLSKRAV